MFSIKKRVDFYDCDPAGILFFGRIFSFAHHAYELFLEELLPGVNLFKHEKYLIPITHSEADYKSPFYPGEEVSIEIKVSQLKESSFELSYTFIKKDEICAIAKTVHVCVGKEDWKKSPLPEELKLKLQQHQ